MQRRTIAVLFVAGLSVLMWSLLTEREATPSAPRQDASVPPAAPATRPKDAETAAGPASRAVERVAFDPGDAVVAETSEANAAEAIVRGRCVDAATGAPLAACRVELHGAPGNSRRLDEHVARRGKVVWENPPVRTTGDDGTFEFRFRPPPPYQFFLFVTAADRADMSARWNQLAPGAIEDVGDVPMQRGTRLRGRVVDDGGTPMANVDLLFSLTDAARTGVGPRGSHQLRTRSDGAFGDERRLPSGRYVLSVPSGSRSIEPSEFTLVGEGDRELDFTVVATKEADTISGEIVDEANAPVARADIDDSSTGRGARRLVRSNKDGAFKIERPENASTEPIRISARLEGYESATTSEPVPWGTKGVRLVMRRGAGVDVVVRDGDRGGPIEEYGVRCFPSLETSSLRSSDMARLREAGSHPDGVLRLQGLVRGSHWLVVEPAGEEWLPSAVHLFEVTDVGAPRQEVAVRRPVRRTVRVKKAKGSPVVATVVDVVRRAKPDQTVDEKTSATTIDGLAMNPGRAAMLLSAGKTDEGGEVVLRAPPGERLVLRVLGPGHPPLIRDVDFDDPGVLEIVVAAGATFAGRIGPPEILPQLHQGDEEAARAFAGDRPGVSLRRGGPGGAEFPGGRTIPALGVDGSFRLEGVPPGEWDVHLHYSQVNTFSRMVSSYVLGRVVLVDGEEVVRDYDLPGLLKANVEGVVTFDDQPLDSGSLTFEGVASGVEGAQSVMVQNIATDAEGRYVVDLPPGEYRTVVQYVAGDRPYVMVGGESFRVRPGEKVRRNVAVRRSSLKVRLFGSDGRTPVVGIKVRVDVGSWPAWSQPSDAQGFAEVEGVQAGPAHVLVGPKELAGEAAQLALARSGKNAAEAMVRVATVVVTPPETAATVQLPASAGY